MMLVGHLRIPFSYSGKYRLLELQLPAGRGRTRFCRNTSNSSCVVTLDPTVVANMI